MGDMKIFGEKAFAELEDTFSDLIKASDDIPGVLQVAADAFIKDLKALPSPRSDISAAGYTHMLDSFATKKQGESVLIGWGKYYGPILENGSKKMRPHRHFRPTWDRNKEKYYKLMTNKLTGGL